MITPIVLHGVAYGEGEPKVIVPIVGRTQDEIIAKAQEIAPLPVHMVEWRADHFDAVSDRAQMLCTLAALRETLPGKALLFTIRSQREGGARLLTTELYASLTLAAAQSGNTDLVDVEVYSGDEVVRRLFDGAHAANCLVVGSYHDFQRTPPASEMLAHLRHMQALGADIPKLAVMPNSVSDVIALLSATSEMHTCYADRPIITMSMGPLGVISRLSGEVFGSAMTFGAVGQVSAPGQIASDRLSSVLQILHSAL